MLLKRLIVRLLEHGCAWKDNIFCCVHEVGPLRIYYPFEHPQWLFSHVWVDWSDKLDKRWGTEVWSDELK